MTYKARDLEVFQQGKAALPQESKQIGLETQKNFHSAQKNDWLLQSFGVLTGDYYSAFLYSLFYLLKRKKLEAKVFPSGVKTRVAYK